MGYDSITAIAAAKIEYENRGRKEEAVALFVQIADSNLYETRNGREVMSRSWNLIMPNSGWRVMQEVVKMAASCESGMLRYKGKSNTRAETLISACRKAIESAPTVENLFNLGDQISQTSIELAINPSTLEDYKKEDLKKLLECEGVRSRERSEDTVVVSVPANAEGMALLDEYGNFGAKWSGGTIGPWDFDAGRYERWAKPFINTGPQPIAISVGDTVKMREGIRYTYEGNKINELLVVSEGGKKNHFLCRGVLDDGSHTSAFTVKINPAHVASSGPKEEPVLPLAENTDQNLFEFSQGRKI